MSAARSSIRRVAARALDLRRKKPTRGPIYGISEGVTSHSAKNSLHVESSRVLKLSWSTKTAHGELPIAILPAMVTYQHYALGAFEVPIIIRSGEHIRRREVTCRARIPPSPEALPWANRCAWGRLRPSTGRLRRGRLDVIAVAGAPRLMKTVCADAGLEWIGYGLLPGLPITAGRHPDWRASCSQTRLPTPAGAKVIGASRVGSCPLGRSAPARLRS